MHFLDINMQFPWALLYTVLWAQYAYSIDRTFRFYADSPKLELLSCLLRSISEDLYPSLCQSKLA